MADKMQIPADWKPTPENVNALPEPIRRYIHAIEMRSDPAGDIRELAFARERIRQLEAKLADALASHHDVDEKS
jgi:hypothetical protein